MAVQTASPVQPHHAWSISSTSLLDLMPIVLWHQNLQITEAGHQIEVDADAYLLFPNESEQTWPTICPDVLIT